MTKMSLCCYLVAQLYATLFPTQWTVAHRAFLSMGFRRQEYWSRLSFGSPGDLPDAGIRSSSAGGFFTTGEAHTGTSVQ